MASTTLRLFKVLIGGFLLAVMTACSPLKMLNALTPDGTFDKTEGIAYGSDARQKLDVYVPGTRWKTLRWWCFSMVAVGTAVLAAITALSAKRWRPVGLSRCWRTIGCIRRCAIRHSLRMAPRLWPGPTNTFASFPVTLNGCT